MKYDYKHSKIIFDRVHSIEKQHKTCLKRILKQNTEYHPEYIYEEFLGGIKKKKNRINTFHPGNDRFIENIFTKMRHEYFSIIQAYKTDHIKRLEVQLIKYKAHLISSYSKYNGDSESYNLGISFFRNFNIRQAINFIARDIAYEKMVDDPYFVLSSKEEPIVVSTVESGLEDEVPNIVGDLKIKKLEDQIRELQQRQSENTMFTAKEAADFTGFSLNTIRQKTSDGKIPFHKLPNSSAVRYSRDQLLEWMRGKKQESGASLLQGITSGIKRNRR